MRNNNDLRASSRVKVLINRNELDFAFSNIACKWLLWGNSFHLTRQSVCKYVGS